MKTANGWNEETVEEKKKHQEKNAKKTASAGKIKK